MQRNLLSEVSTVVDVGANVGQFAERVRDLGFGGRVISFEPGAEAFRLLQQHASRSGDWEVRKLALGQAPGVARLNIARNSVSSSLLQVENLHVRADPKSETAATEQVQVSTLDIELNQATQDPLYLKLDVQGFELSVLRGGDATLGKTRVVQVEVSFDDLYAEQTDWLSLCRHLQDRGFRVRYVDPGYEDRQTGRMLQADLVFVREP